MSRTNIKDIQNKINIMQAYVNGEEIEYRVLSYPPKKEWYRDQGPILFNWDTYEYRVRPEDVQVWVNTYESGIMVAYLSQRSALKSALKANSVIVKVAVCYTVEPDTIMKDGTRFRPQEVEV